MANLMKLCKKYFGKKDLYEVFDINKNATDKDSEYILEMYVHRRLFVSYYWYHEIVYYLQLRGRITDFL